MSAKADALRLAFFSPVPPTPSGIADYTADLMPLLPAEWEIEIFASESAADRCGRVSVYPVSEWRERHRRRPFALNVYQVGNSAAHADLLPLVREHPGLLVLHDVVLHPSRVSDHIGRVDLAGYRRAATASEGEVGPALAHLVAAGLGSPALYWRFALSADLVRASRLTVVHGELLARWAAALIPDAEIDAVAHWRAVPKVAPEAVQSWRERLGAANGTPLIGSFGHMGEAHRIDVVLGALARLADGHEFRAVLVGGGAPELRLPERAAELGLGDRVSWTGAVSATDFAALLRSVDIGLNLRYPSARSSSGTLQQLLQLGVPTAISDLVHLRDVPDAAVLRVPPRRAADAEATLSNGLAVWLTAPDTLRQAATAARHWAARAISPERMAASYRDAVERALGGVTRPTTLPPRAG